MFWDKNCRFIKSMRKKLFDCSRFPVSSSFRLAAAFPGVTTGRKGPIHIGDCNQPVYLRAISLQSRPTLQASLSVLRHISCSFSCWTISYPCVFSRASRARTDSQINSNRQSGFFNALMSTNRHCYWIRNIFLTIIIKCLSAETCHAKKRRKSCGRSAATVS